MGKSISIVLILILGILTSCTNDTSVDPIAGEGDVTLSFSSQTLSKALNKTTVAEVANVVVDIKDAGDNVIYTNKIIKLIKMGEEYISEPISLTAGAHKLEKFLVTDQNNVVLYATPVSGSPTAYLVSEPLSISFDIVKNQTKKITPDVVKVDNLSASDFGYATFGFNTINTVAPKISVFSYNSSTLNYELTTAKITVYNEDNVVITKDLAAETTTIPLKEKDTDYIFLVQKAGFTAYINKFNKTELANFNANPLEITLAGNNQDSFTKLFIDGEGIDGQPVIYDNSSSLKQITAGGVVTKTDAKKHGVSSIYFDGVNDYMAVPDSEDFYFGSGDFTIDCWVKFSSIPQGKNAVIFAQGLKNNQDNCLGLFYKNSTNYLTEKMGVWQVHLSNADGVTWTDHFSETMIPDLTKWYHIAWVRKGNSLKLYIDGQMKIEAPLTAGQQLSNSTQPFHIGAGNPTSGFFNGYIDDFRVSKGVARWDGNFTP